MKFREYIEDDFECIQNWIQDERTHVMWCANMIPYPLTLKEFSRMLEKDRMDWGGKAFICENEEKEVVGFFVYSVNRKDNSAFLKFVVMAKQLRGQGYGTQMVRQVLQQLLEIENVKMVKLNVFDCNIGAKKCYEKAGFIQQQYTTDAFIYQDEVWGRCFMVAKAETT